ncbi:MAG: aspartate/glutamate racemase family protein [Desulfobacterales bacterium]|nr:aspartate/glutamate racemase family protein [Desulfobacterales bacterium]
MIGVIDAGVAGLYIVDALLKKLPGQDIVYYSDTAHAPYGNRSAETIIRGALEGAEYVWRCGARILVTASHTISAVAFDALYHRFGKALFDITTVAAEMAIARSHRKRIGLVASRATAESRRYEELIRARCAPADIFVAACPLWAPLVEEGWQKRRETAMVVKRGVRAIKQRDVDTLILGSSAFVALRQVIQRKIGSQVVLVEATAGLVSRVAEHLQNQEPPPAAAVNGRKVQLLVTDLTPQVTQAARRLGGGDVKLERAA